VPETPKQPRFHAPDLSAKIVRLSAGEAHHALHVLRLGTGAAVTLFDGRGSVADGHVATVRRSAVDVRVEARRPAEPRPGPTVHVAFAVPKGKRLDWLLEKATELAAASLEPVLFERSVAAGGLARLSPTKRQRWQAHCIAAAKQSGLNWLPDLADPRTLGDFLADALTGPAGYVGLVGVVNGGSKPIREVLSQAPAGRELCLLIGPEGGLTRSELVDAVQAGFVPVRLGRTTLRVETAALALLAAAMAVYPDK